MTVRTVLGLDVGGSSLKFQLSEARGEGKPIVLKRDKAPTPHERPLEVLAELVRSISDGTELVGVAIAIPGLVDEAAGTILRSVNIPSLDGLALGPELSALVCAPVSVVNDGRAAAIAEARWGAGHSHSNVFTIALGTGIAGSHIIDGQVAPGAHGIAGELGHIVVEPEGALCGCGQRGCLETVIGAPAMRRAWHRAGGEGSPRDLLAAYESGDERAFDVVRRAGGALGDALLTLLALVDPGCIVIGGGLASAPHRLVTLAAERVQSHKSFHAVPPIVPARIGRWAGAAGCVGIAQERLAATV